MLVEINLLTAKEKKDLTKWFLAAIIVILLFSSFITIKVINNWVQNDIDELENERAVVLEKLAEIEQIDQEKPVSFAEQLAISINKIESEVIPGSKLLREVVRLLPEHGYLLDFNFDHPDTVTFQAHFDQIGAVAAYNYELTESQYIDSVILRSINTEAVGSEPETESELEINTDSEFLPRYIAYFKLKVNRSAFLGRGDQ